MFRINKPYIVYRISQRTLALAINKRSEVSDRYYSTTGSLFHLYLIQRIEKKKRFLIFDKTVAHMYVIMAFRYITYCSVLIKHLSYNMSSKHSGYKVPSGHYTINM